MAGDASESIEEAIIHMLLKDKGPALPSLPPCNLSPPPPPPHSPYHTFLLLLLFSCEVSS